MLHCALYVKKSAYEKNRLLNIDKVDKNFWKAFGSEEAYTIDKVYEEETTTKNASIRPAYEELLKDIQTGVINAILVWKISHLARNIQEAGKLDQLLDDGKLKEIRTPVKIFKQGFPIDLPLEMRSLSPQERLDHAYAVYRGKNAMLKRGGWPYTAKFGYMHTQDPVNRERHILVKIPDSDRIIRKAFEMMLSGSYSVHQIIDEMNLWIMRTRSTPKQSGGPTVSYASGYNLFTDPFYAGFTMHNGVPRKGTHPPFISVEEYNLIQDILKDQGFSRKPLLKLTSAMVKAATLLTEKQSAQS